MRFAVIGAGHGGQALAGYLAYQGMDVTLYNRTPEVIEHIRAHGGIELAGIVQAKLENIVLTSSIEHALADVDVVMVSVPAHAHPDLAKLMAPHLSNRHSVVLVPGRTLGAFNFADYLANHGCRWHITVAETDTFLLTSRKVSDGVSEIIALKRAAHVAAVEQAQTALVQSVLSLPFPMVTSADSMLYTSLSNIGPIFHPLPSLLNIGRIENKQTYMHYTQGITPRIAHLVEELDSERIGLADKMGISIPSAKQWLYEVYGANGRDLYETIQNTQAYNAICAPTEIYTRYIYEDILTGVVPMYCLAKEIGSPHRIMSLTIDLATHLCGYNFIEHGRNNVREFLENFSLPDRCNAGGTRL